MRWEEDNVHVNHSIRALTVTSVLMDIMAFLNVNVIQLFIYTVKLLLGDRSSG